MAKSKVSVVFLHGLAKKPPPPQLERRQQPMSTHRRRQPPQSGFGRIPPDVAAPKFAGNHTFEINGSPQTKISPSCVFLYAPRVAGYSMTILFSRTTVPHFSISDLM